MLRSFFLGLFSVLLAAQASADTMTKEQIVGSLLMMGFEGKTPDAPGSQKIMQMIKNYDIGGVLTVNRNFGPGDQAKKLGQALQEATPDRLPVLVAIDQEGGLIQRLGPDQGWKEMLSPSKVAASMSVNEASAMYGRVACVLQDWGFTYTLGPVVDLAVEPNNPIITKLGRSFGTDADLVTSYAAGAVKSAQKCGVLTTLKHFPGHGSSIGDSHKGFVDITQSWDAKELEPYVKLIRIGLAPSIMTAHVSNLNMDANLPASLSPVVVDHLLRKRLDYQGMVITDDLEMKAITNLMSIPQAAVLALAAGNDMIMVSTPVDVEPELAGQIRKAILDAVEQGQIPWQRVIEAHNAIKINRATIARL